MLDQLIELANALGKQKMVLESSERCGYVGVLEDRRRHQEEYDRRLAAFVAEVRRLIGKPQGPQS